MGSVGGSGGASAGIAGERGLRFAANYHVATSSVLDAVEAYRSAFRPSKVLAEPYVSFSADVVVATSDDHARQLSTGYGPLPGGRKQSMPWLGAGPYGIAWGGAGLGRGRNSFSSTACAAKGRAPRQASHNAGAAIDARQTRRMRGNEGRVVEWRVGRMRNSGRRDKERSS